MNCPSCAAELPSLKFKFCPFCGAVVTAPRAPSPAGTAPRAPSPAGTVAAPVTTVRDTIAEPMPAMRDTLPEPVPAVRPAPQRAVPPVNDTIPEPALSIRASAPRRSATIPPAKASSQAPRRSRELDTEAATVFEMPSVDAAALHAAMSKKHESHQNMARPVPTGELDKVEVPSMVTKAVVGQKAAATAGPAVRREPPAKSATEDDRPTAVSLPAITDADLSPISARTRRAPTPGATVKPEPVKPEPVKSAVRSVAPTVAPPAVAPSTKKKFSETAWFLAAVDPDQLAETETAAAFDVNADALTRRYVPPEPLSDAVRRDFSLGSTDEPTPAPKKKR
jgi:hypothetical protein